MSKDIQDVRAAIREGVLRQRLVSELKNWPLLHFSEHAEQIQREGFRKGEQNVAALDCTYKGPNTQRDYQHPGYAFAFNAVSWDEENACLDYQVAGPDSQRGFTGMYGDRAVLFLGDGIYTRHPEEFHQVICWGPDIDCQQAMYLENTGPQILDGEVVQDENGNAVDCWMLRDAQGIWLVTAEDHFTLEECVVKALCIFDQEKKISLKAKHHINALYSEILEQFGYTIILREKALDSACSLHFE
jgi:hypothetical protein